MLLDVNFKGAWVEDSKYYNMLYHLVIDLTTSIYDCIEIVARKPKCLEFTEVERDMRSTVYEGL